MILSRTGGKTERRVLRPEAGRGPVDAGRLLVSSTVLVRHAFHPHRTNVPNDPDRAVDIHPDDDELMLGEDRALVDVIPGQSTVQNWSLRLRRDGRVGQLVSVTIGVDEVLCADSLPVEAQEVRGPGPLGRARPSTRRTDLRKEEYGFHMAVRCRRESRAWWTGRKTGCRCDRVQCARPPVTCHTSR